MPQNVKWVPAICQVCKKEFQAINYRLLHGKDKYCSRMCRAKSPEFKEQLARMIETRQQKAYAKHPKWKDGKRLCLDCEKPIWIMGTRCKPCFSKTQVGTKRIILRNGQSAYEAIHQWVKRQLGTPMICIKCLDSSQGIYDWANISGEYKKDLSDWIRLCRKCHSTMDKKPKGSLKRDFMERMKRV